MKSKRLTLVCMATIALLGTPRAWEEAGNLLAFAQQKAQLKFWSMVMRPSEPAEVELVAVAETPEAAAPSANKSSCPFERHEQRENQVAASYRRARKAESAPARPKALRLRQESADGLIAHARKAAVERERAQRPRHTVDAADFQLLEIAESLPASSDSHEAKAMPPARAITADTSTFVELPVAAPVAAVFQEKDVAYQFKLLKKSFSEGKLSRQKGRLPAVRITTPFPAS